MTEVEMDETEVSLGISAYMSPAVPGFDAVVKARYSDFIVHEVDLDGNLAVLTNQDLLKDESLDQKQKDSKPKATKIQVPSRDQKGVVAPSTADVKSDAKDTDNTTQKVSAGAAKSDDPKEESKTDTDKLDKSEITDSVWTSLQSALEGMIQNKDVAQSVMDMLVAHNNKTTKEIDGVPKFVTLPSLEKAQRKQVHHWVRESLTCARADTLDGNIRIWHRSFEKEMPNYKAFGNSHNIKQPRAKKSKASWPEDRPDYLQFVLYKENMDTTTATKDLSRKGSSARIGFAGMKDKRGITTQFCTLYRTEPQQIWTLANSGGGGNTRNRGYSVVQVGNFEYTDREMRLGRLKGNRFDVVLRNIQDNPSKEQLTKAADSLKEHGFINYFGTQRFGKYNDTHLVGIEVLKGDYGAAIDIIMRPKPDERPDIAKGREIWQNRFKDKEVAPEVEAACAKEVSRSLTRFMSAEVSLMQALSRKPLEYRQAFSRISKTLRMMFLHAVQSLVWNKVASYRIDSMSRENVLEGDLVMVDDSSDEVHLVTKEDIESSRFSLDDVVLPLVGTKSIYPSNEAGEMTKKLFGELGVTIDMIGKIPDRDLIMPGSYRKVICRPSDVSSNIIEYYDKLQPMIQTDLMKLRGESITIIPRKEEGDKLLLGMTVGFTLPSSAYATIALRELTKRPTSGEYQRDLKLD